MSDGRLEAGGAVAIVEAHHGLNLLFVAALLQRLLELILRRNVGGIVLVYLVPAVSLLAVPAARCSIPDCTSSRERSPCCQSMSLGALGRCWSQLQWP